MISAPKVVQGIRDEAGQYRVQERAGKFTPQFLKADGSNGWDTWVEGGAPVTFDTLGRAKEYIYKEAVVYHSVELPK